MDDDTTTPLPLGDALAEVTRDLGLGDARTVGALVRQWEAVVGESIARHARPVRLRDGVLVVEVDGPAWATQLRYLSTDLSTRLNEALGAAVIDAVRVTVRGREIAPE